MNGWNGSIGDCASRINSLTQTLTLHLLSLLLLACVKWMYQSDNELQQKLLKSAVVADLRLTQKIIDAAKEAAAKDHSDVETEIASGGASGGGGPESAADRAKRLRQKADALKQISEDLATAEANLKESVEVARGVQHDHLAQKLAARKEKMSARGVTPA